jgi:hypothetical protein
MVIAWADGQSKTSYDQQWHSPGRNIAGTHHEHRYYSCGVRRLLTQMKSSRPSGITNGNSQVRINA